MLRKLAISAFGAALIGGMLFAIAGTAKPARAVGVNTFNGCQSTAFNWYDHASSAYVRPNDSFGSTHELTADRGTADNWSAYYLCDNGQVDGFKLESVAETAYVATDAWGREAADTDSIGADTFYLTCDSGGGGLEDVYVSSSGDAPLYTQNCFHWFLLPGTTSGCPAQTISYMGVPSDGC